MLPPPEGVSGFNGPVADSQYPYPPDRFDDEADAATFHGAHRAEEPFWRQNLIYLVIIAAAFVTLLVLFMSFAVVQWKQFRARARGGRFADPVVAERAYLLLSLVAKSVLAWQVFANVLIDP